MRFFVRKRCITCLLTYSATGCPAILNAVYPNPELEVNKALRRRLRSKTSAVRINCSVVPLARLDFIKDIWGF